MGMKIAQRPQVQMDLQFAPAMTSTSAALAAPKETVALSGTPNPPPTPSLLTFLKAGASRGAQEGNLVGRPLGKFLSGLPVAIAGVGAAGGVLLGTAVSSMLGGHGLLGPFQALNVLQTGTMSVGVLAVAMAAMGTMTGVVLGSAVGGCLGALVGQTVGSIVGGAKGLWTGVRNQLKGESKSPAVPMTAKEIGGREFNLKIPVFHRRSGAIATSMGMVTGVIGGFGAMAALFVAGVPSVIGVIGGSLASAALMGTAGSSVGVKMEAALENWKSGTKA